MIAPPARKRGRRGDLTSPFDVIRPPGKERGLREKPSAALEGAVVFTVNVAVEGPSPPMIVTEEGILQVGGSTGLGMLVLTAQLRFTRPRKLPEGVAVIVIVLPVVAPGVTVIFPLLLRLKP
jgi:hypothetical protein